MHLFYYLTNWLQTKTKRKRYGRILYIHSRKIQWWVIILLHKFAPNIKAPSYLEETLLNLKSQTNLNTVIVGNFNIPLSSIMGYLVKSGGEDKEKTLRAKSHHKSNGPLTEIFRTFYLNTKDRLFSAAHWDFLQNRWHIRTYSKFEQIIGKLKSQPAFYLTTMD